MGRVGNALADVGAPFGESTSLVDNGKSRAAAASSGYSILEAKDLAITPGSSPTATLICRKARATTPSTFTS